MPSTSGGRVSDHALGRARPIPVGGPAFDAGLEVYVFCRPFTEFGGRTFQRLPQTVKGSLTQIGVCHFLAAVRTREGRVHVFDFGPVGGDVTLGLQSPFPKARQQPPAEAPWYSLACQGPSAPSRDCSVSSTAFFLDNQGQSRGAVGEIRERVLPDLPPNHMYVGRTSLTLREIREYNQLQNSRYELNTNDCRHYVNNLVRFTTGVPSASGALTEYNLMISKQGQLAWNDQLTRFAQQLTDVNNWPTIRSVGQATLTAAAVVLGRLGIQPIVRSSALTAVVPARLTANRLIAHPAGNATLAAAASVATDLRDKPPVRGVLTVGSRVGNGMQGAASLVSTIGRFATTAASSGISSTSSALVSASFAARSAAAAASRTAERAVAAVRADRQPALAMGAVAEAPPAQKLSPLARISIPSFAAKESA